VQADQSSSSRVSKEVKIEALPPILVLHFERFLYDAAADGMVKISKPVQFAPEFEIPLGTIFPSFSPRWPRPMILRGWVGPEIMAPVSEKSAEPVHYKLFGTGASPQGVGIKRAMAYIPPTQNAITIFASDVTPIALSQAVAAPAT
jgi:hypothetical protein